MNRLLQAFSEQVDLARSLWLGTPPEGVITTGAYLLDEEGDSTMFTRVRADSLWSREARLESLTGERKILEWERAGYRQGTGWAVRPQYSSFR